MLTHDAANKINPPGFESGPGSRSLIACRPGSFNPARSTQAISTRC